MQVTLALAVISIIIGYGLILNLMIYKVDQADMDRVKEEIESLHDLIYTRSQTIDRDINYLHNRVADISSHKESPDDEII